MLVTYERAQQGFRLARRATIVNVRLQNVVRAWPSWSREEERMWCLVSQILSYLSRARLPWGFDVTTA